MRKKVFGKNFSRSRKARLAMYRSLARALVLSGKIDTTLEKAKTLKVYMEKLITVAKRGTVPSRRKLFANLGNQREIADEIVRYAVVNGGIKLIPLTSRKGDAAKMARVEMLGWTVKEKKEASKKKDEKGSKDAGKAKVTKEKSVKKVAVKKEEKPKKVKK
jgi:large subunit ribosomal protein L17